MSTDIEQVLKSSALENGPFRNNRGMAYLFESGSGTLHAVADTGLDPDENPRLRYRRVWNACQGMAFDSRSVTGFGWADAEDLEHLENVCKTCKERLS